MALEPKMQKYGYEMIWEQVEETRSARMEALCGRIL